MKKWIVLVVACAISFLAGRSSGPKSETFKKQYDVAVAENVELRREIAEYTDRVRNLERSKVTTIRQSPDGTKVTRIRDVSRLTSSTSTARTEAVAKSEARTLTDNSTEERTVINRSGAVGSLLLGVSPFDLTKGFDAGASFTVPAWGPTWFGAWGLFKHEIKVGISLGIEI